MPAPQREPAEVLPEWDLSALYAGPDAPAIHGDIENARALCGAFARDYQGRVEMLEGDVLAQSITRYEEIQEILGRLGSYAQLLYSKCMTDAKTAQFYQNTQELLTDLSSQTLFFTLSLNKLDDAALERSLKSSKALQKYAPWLRDVRAYRPYQLADDMEKLLHEKYVSGRGAWTRLFDETIAAMRFPYGKEKLTEPEILNLLSSRDAQTRKKAAKVIGEVFKRQAPVFTLITNTLAKDKEIEDRWRKFPKPISSRNVSNYIEDEVVDALIHAVRASYPKLSHRYYKLKAGWFGKKQLPYWDRNAPLPFEAERSYSWNGAQELVLTAYRNFSPRLAETGERFFRDGWIDAPVIAGKSPGAFAHPTVPSAHPYLLLNFQGKTRDVMTLAHELGHGVHQVFSARQGALLADTPLTLAETASVFGEQLTFREMLKREQEPLARKALIAGKVEDMLNTVVRQTAFCLFEIKLHDARRGGELTAEQIGDIWLEVQKEALGKALKLDGDYRYFWTYIPHFIHSPFYVYAYAFGDCLVNSLYAVYEQEKTAGRGAEFEKKYIAMLEAGGTLRHKELLAPFGLDATDPAFWQKGLNIVSGFIDELEK